MPHCNNTVSYHISSCLCLPAKVDQPLQLIRRIVRFQLAAVVSCAQCQSGPAAHSTNEDVINPASDHGTENPLRHHRVIEVKPKQFPFDYVPPCWDAVSRSRLQVSSLLGGHGKPAQTQEIRSSLKCCSCPIKEAVKAGTHTEASKQYLMKTGL